MTLEAILLHYIDNIDAKAKIFTESTDRAREEGEQWTQWLGFMERRLFAGP
jgi:23S rRNA maturation-related 3'-5' exoribonuclease YhaM